MNAIKEWIVNLILDSLKGTAAENLRKEELDQWLTDFMNRRFQDFGKGGQAEELAYQSLFHAIINSLGGLSGQKQENFIMSEETLMGKTLLFRYILLYKNEEDQIMYLRAAALLKNEGRNSAEGSEPLL